MRDLMVGDSEGTAVLEIENLALVATASLEADREIACVAQGAVDPDRVAHRHDAVLADDERLHSEAAADIEQPADDAVDLPEFLADRWMSRSDLLQRVVEMREIREGER